MAMAGKAAATHFDFLDLHMPTPPPGFWRKVLKPNTLGRPASTA